MNKLKDRGQQSIIMGQVNRSVRKQGPVAAKHVAKLRRKNPDASPEKIIDLLSREYRILTVGAGAGAGAAAAVPGIGTVTSLLLSGGEAVWFIEITARYVMSIAEVYGVEPGDFERRRALVLGVLTGQAGAQAVRAAKGTEGQAWARNLGKPQTGTRVEALNRSLGKNFVSRYAVRKGAGMFGRAFPFGVGAAIGGVANFAAADAVIRAAKEAFGATPTSWDARPVHVAPAVLEELDES